MRMVGIGLLAAGIAYAAFAPGDKATSGASPDDRPAARSISDAALLDGVWRSRGYGWVVEIEDGEVRFYDETATSCLANRDGERKLADMSAWFEVSDDGRTLRLPIDDPTYLYTFDRIDAMPDNCRDDPDDHPAAVLDTVIDLFSKHYAFFEERNVDWDRLTERSRRTLSRDPSDDRLLEVVGELVTSVDDAHVSLVAEHDGDWEVRETGDGPTLRRVAEQARREDLSVQEMRERWEYRYWVDDMEAILADNEVHWALNDRMVYGLIGDDVGYIALATMEGYTRRGGGAEADIRALDKTMERVLELFEDVDAVIVDISMNDGGYDMVARAFAGRFAAERTLGYYKFAGDAKADTPQAIHVEPSEGRRYTGPVYLLTSDYSMSAAEIFTMAMRALPNVTHLGQATRGTLSDELSKPLPNGWSISLSNEVYLDAEGIGWEGKGIPPQVALEVFSREDVTRGHVEAVNAIVNAVRSGQPVDPARG